MTILRVLKLIYRKMQFRNTRLDGILTSYIYTNPRFKRFVCGPRNVSHEQRPELRNIMTQLDHNQLCSLGENLKPLSLLLNQGPEEIKKYADYFHLVGFRPKSDQMPSEPLNFRMRSTTEYHLSKAIINIERDSEGYLITAHESIFDEVQFESWMFRILAVMRNYPIGVQRIIERSEAMGGGPQFYLDISDGAKEYESSLSADSHMYTFCRNSTSLSVGLIPDAYTLRDLEYEIPPHLWNSESEAKADYAAREKKLFWRGGTTGRPPQNSISANRRVQFCIQSLRYSKLVDAKITHVYHFDNNDRSYGELARLNCTARPVPESNFGRYSSFVDLDGNSGAWGTFRKYLRLIHVIKPESQYSLFSHLLQPSDSFTSVRHESEIFEALDVDSGYIDHFEVAWRGYKSALKIRQLVIEGDATIFPQ